MGTQRTRREFLGNVGRGMLVASVGFGTAFDMGLTPAWADEDGGERLAFGGLEPLVGLMQDTPARKPTETAAADPVPDLIRRARAAMATPVAPVPVTPVATSGRISQTDEPVREGGF